MLRPVTDPPAPPEEDEEEEEGPSAEPAEHAVDTPGRRRPVLLTAALFGLSVGLAVLAAFLANRLDAERDRDDDIREVAGQFTAAFLTYDFERLEQSKDRVLDLATGNFKRQYEKVFTGGLDVLLKETKARSEATVTDIYLGEVVDDTATAIVVADAKAEGAAGSRRTIASYVRLELVKVGGRWRVDGVTNLDFGQGAGTGAGATTTTTTTPE